MIRIARTARALALVSLVALIATALAQGMNHGQMRGGAAQPGAAVSPMGMVPNGSDAVRPVKRMVGHVGPPGLETTE